MTGDLCHGDGFGVPACGNALDHHVPGDDPPKPAIFPAHRQHCHTELAHPVARLPQGRLLADVSHSRLRGLSRPGHRDPPLFPPDLKTRTGFPARLNPSPHGHARPTGRHRAKGPSVSARRTLLTATCTGSAARQGSTCGADSPAREPGLPVRDGGQLPLVIVMRRPSGLASGTGTLTSRIPLS